MGYNQKNFQEKDLEIKDKNYKYFLSPIFVKNNFKHGFFTNKSSSINLSLLSKHLNLNNFNCKLDQIHSNQIVCGSKTQGNKFLKADGMFNDKDNQNLCIYTADCMPILFADKRKRFVAAIHCGRKGLEKKIIKNIINIFHNQGSSYKDIIVAIGPSISREYYLVDYETFYNFYINAFYEKSIFQVEDKDIKLKLRQLINSKNQVLIPLDLKKSAHIQLLNENIQNINIDISNLCTYESNHYFHSWRRSKTFLRQWNFISP